MAGFGNISDPSDPRWEEIVRLSPFVQRWCQLMLEVRALDEGLGPDEEVRTPEQMEIVEVIEESQVVPRRRSGQPAPPVEEVDVQSAQRHRGATDRQVDVAYERILTRRQWDAWNLYYREHKTIREIAEALGIGVKAAHHRIKRANKRIDQYDLQLRAERFNLLRGKTAKDGE